MEMTVSLQVPVKAKGFTCAATRTATKDVRHAESMIVINYALNTGPDTAASRIIPQMDDAGLSRSIQKKDIPW